MKNLKYFLTVLVASLVAIPFSFAEKTSGALSEESYVEAKQEFSFAIAREILERDGAELSNLFLSPTSLNLALSMLLEGARSQTYDEMLWALGYPQGTDVMDVHQLNKNYVELIQSRDNEGFTLSINNSIWSDESFPLTEEFVKNVGHYYTATIGTRDFRSKSQSVSDEINDWACSSTEKRICKVIDANTVQSLDLLMANAIYFKGTWVQSFDSKLTQMDSFKVAGDSARSVAMMSSESRFYYFEKDGAQVVKIPFKGEKSSMFVVLPPKGESERFASWMADEMFQTNFWMNVDQEGSMRIVDLKLPKFKLSSSRILNEDLKSMGMRSIFDHADLSGLSLLSTRVDFVKQDAFIQVDEEGAEAAAVTTIGATTTGAEPELRASMNVNRPFFIGIRDDLRGEFLFFGVITDPAWEE